MDEEGAGGRARTQLLQLVVMGPLNIAPLLDLRRGQEMPWSEWLVPSARQPGPHTIRVAGVRATGFDLAKTCLTRVVGEVVGKNTQVAGVGTPVLQDMHGLRGGQSRPRPSGCPLLGRPGTKTTCASPLRPNLCCSHTSFPHGGCKMSALWGCKWPPHGWD